MSAERPRGIAFAGRMRALVGLVAMCAGAGCASRGSTDLLEANLRQHQDRLIVYERQVSTLRDELASARAETDQLRRELVALGKEGSQEASEPLSRVAGIQFNSMMTGGRDADDAPGHDVITAVLAPHDKDGDLVKLAGELQIEVLDLTRPADKQRIGQWKYSAEEARALWHSGFLASGYQLDLPVGAVPKDGEVILHGRLVTPDGRQFDTTYPVALASADSGKPRGFPLTAPMQSVSDRRSRSGSNQSVSREVKTAAAEIASERVDRPVEQAGFAFVDTETKSEPSRPVPRPLEVPEVGGLPVVRPGVSPRPFPAEHSQKPAATARPFPAGITTSDSWTDETIPHLR
jgi:hypothetical protein